jgi:hypothetical protein
MLPKNFALSDPTFCVRGVPFSTLLDDALTYSRANNGQRSTDQLEGKFAELRAEFGGRDASAIKRPEIVAWLARESEERGGAAATRNRWQAAWSLVFSVAIENEKLQINPASKIRRNRSRMDGSYSSTSPRKKDA